MEQAPLVLLHWEAFYPYLDLQKSLEQTASSQDFPHERVNLALPYNYLRQATSALEHSRLNFGANDMLNATAGTFTESIAVKALQEAKATFVLLGKASERHAHPEYAASTHHKLQQALNNQIPVFFCFGESIEEAENGRTAEVILAQLKTAFEGIDSGLLSQVHFVYDTPTALMDKSNVQPESRDQTFEICRQQYAALWGEKIALSLKTLCALPSHLPIPETFFSDSPFAGLYFKMDATDLGWLLNTWPRKNSTPKVTEASPINEELPPAEEAEQGAKKRAPRKKAPKDTEADQLDPFRE